MISNIRKINIQRIIDELKPTLIIDKNQFLNDKIKLRLEDALKSYYYELEKSFEKLYQYSEKHELILAKKFNKEI